MKRTLLPLFAAISMLASPALAEPAPEAPSPEAVLAQANTLFLAARRSKGDRPRVIRDWREGEPIPEGYEVRSRMRLGLVIGGSVMFGVSYLSSVFTAAIADDVGSDDLVPLYVPVLGPFITLGNVDSSVGQVLLITDGLLQAGGVTMLVLGILMPNEYLVLTETANGGRIELSPLAGLQSNGLGVVGTF